MAAWEGSLECRKGGLGFGQQQQQACSLQLTVWGSTVEEHTLIALFEEDSCLKRLAQARMSNTGRRFNMLSYPIAEHHYGANWPSTVSSMV
jgi:hypothetical protein